MNKSPFKCFKSNIFLLLSFHHVFCNVLILPHLHSCVLLSVSDEETPLPRLCKIVKQSDGFGFHLNGESGDRPGQYIRRLMNDGAAEKGGLLNGDRVVEVNGANISHKSHDDVVKMIVKAG
ncbi:Na(+)/H(+) exchange regulatory cofactor NHE-RF1-like [Ciona intestinalis]